MNKERCKEVLKSGKECRAYALNDSEHCIFHDSRPEIVQIRGEAAKKAGLSQKIPFPEITDGKLPELVKPINIRKPRDIKKGIVRTLQEIRCGRIDTDMGRTLLYGFNVLLSFLEKVELRREEAKKEDAMSPERKAEIEALANRLSKSLNSQT